MTLDLHSRVRRSDPLQLISHAVTRIYSWWLRTTYPFAAVGRRLSAHCTSEIDRAVAHRIRLGDGVTLFKHVWLNVSLPPEEDGEPVLTIEDGCAIGHRTTISAKNEIHLERDVITAQSVLIMDHSHAYEDATRSIKHQGVTDGGRIRIGQGSWIGHGAAVICTKGELTLGHNCVVAANSLVTRGFPPYSVISGNPARIVKQFDPENNVWVLGATRKTEVALTQ
jgi:acetyltransferase-like isoleucine patch superfamily enzyme